MELTFDTHGMDVLSAQKALERFIAQAPQACTVIRVIHGYHHGDAIKTMVQDVNQLRSKRIVRRNRTLNPGETLLVIQP